MTEIKFRVHHRNETHVHVRVYTRASPVTWALSGELVFLAEEWDSDLMERFAEMGTVEEAAPA